MNELFLLLFFWITFRFQNTLAEKVCYENYGCFSNISPIKYIGNTYYPLPESPEEIDTTFILHNRYTNEKGEVLDNKIDTILSSSIIDESETYFIVHGYLSSSRNLWVKELKDKLLESGDFNVILVDWELGADGKYEISACNTRLVGAQISFLITKLEIFKKASRKRVHLIGHSLGAHVCGFAGKKLPGLARITGLDPANPSFDEVKTDFRLNRKDAMFVDVIHTCAYTSTYKFSLGMSRALGHADFYPNGGGGQPECYSADLICSHSIATALYTVSITTENAYIGKKCPGKDEFLNHLCDSCQGNKCNSMGFYARKPEKPTSYYLITKPLTPESGVTYSTFWNTVKGSVECKVLGYCSDKETKVDKVIPKTLQSKNKKKKSRFEWIQGCFGLCKKTSNNALPKKTAKLPKDVKTEDYKSKSTSKMNLEKKETWFEYIKNCLGFCRSKRNIESDDTNHLQIVKKKFENLQNNKMIIKENDLQTTEGEEELSYIGFFIYGDQNLVV